MVKAGVVLLLMGLTVMTGLLGAGVAGLTITVFLHRGLTHHAIRLSRPIYEVGRWLTWLTTFMRHWQWRRVHRKHHRYTDVWLDDVRHDPHSPVVVGAREGIDGFRRVAWHMATIFHSERQLPDIMDGTYDEESDRHLDRLDRIVFDRPVLGAVATGMSYSILLAIVVPVLLGDHRSVELEVAGAFAGAVALAIHIAVMLRFGGAINSDCHRGESFVPGAGYAINVKALSVLIFGEGEHLTHHLHPQLAQISRRWDLGWRVIQVLRFLRLTTVAVERHHVIPA